MERLTRRLIGKYEGKADCAYCTGEYMTKRGCSQRCELRKRQLAKLADYEDVGISPEQARLIFDEWKYFKEELKTGRLNFIDQL